ncbi:hypothetical protein [Streptomyces beijiangensis]|uniref:Uncharacterized protein n=1 Tax=Streptomyces beijiangensis TaxID=163361 RepID=A0A939JIP3_9ACTN|nr:hypothetical protein [Streptomyces beijiangensis]MBO0513887.1 hypothetical protein [Streptomyces beijiangensis]
MTALDFSSGAQAPERPAFWYGLPHGYRQLDIRPTAEGLAETARQILQLPEEQRTQADEVFRMYAGVVAMFDKQQVQGCALGMHPDGDGGLTLSALVVSTVAMPGTNPKAVLAAMLAEGGDDGVRPVELPAGTGFLSEVVRNAMAPSGEDEPVWQGLVAVPDTRTSSVVAVQLVTCSVRLADDYRGILLGVARTLSFTDPELAGGGGDFTPAADGPTAEAMRSDFG